MDSRNKKFIIAGVVIAIVIAILAPFLASSNPDGLESAAEKLNPGVLESAPAVNSPMPDYIIPSLGEDPISGAIAIVIGVVIVFVLAFGVGYVLKRRKDNN
jgi:cobalt/nickel transport protein